MNLFCWLGWHKWHYVSRIERYCLRCRVRHIDGGVWRREWKVCPPYMDMNHYILENGEIKKASLMEWAMFFENFDKRNIAQTNITSVDFPEGIKISTVFLGIDHNFTSEGPPLLFETMVFGMGDESDEICYRSATLEEAQEAHDKLAEALQDNV